MAGSTATYRLQRVTWSSDGSALVQVRVSAPGRIDLLLTAWNDNIARQAGIASLQPANRRFVVARARGTATRTGIIPIRITPDHRGQLLMAHHRYRPTFRLWVTYTPAYANQEKTGRYGLHVR